MFHSINCFFRYIAFLATKTAMEAEWLFFNFPCLSKLSAQHQLSKRMCATKHDVYNAAFNLCQEGMNCNKQSCTSDKQAPEKGSVSAKDKQCQSEEYTRYLVLQCRDVRALTQVPAESADRDPLSL